MKTYSQEKIVLYTLVLVLTIVVGLVVYMRANFVLVSDVSSSTLAVEDLFDHKQGEPVVVKANFSHAVQLGAFTTEAAAQSFLKQMAMVGVKNPYVVKRSSPVRFVVAVGKFDDADQAQFLKTHLQKNDIEGFVIRL